VAFDHDVRAGGLAEARLGAARGCANVAFMPVGTGIAAAMMMDGRMLVGGGYAGELGHVDVGHGVPCACGNIGCVETVGSAAAIARRYTERTGRQVAGSLEVLAAADGGDRDAAVLVEEAIDALAKGLRVLVTLVAPEVVVLGGGLFAAGETLAGPVRERLDGLLKFQRRPEVRLAELGEMASCLGAGLLAWEAAG